MSKQPDLMNNQLNNPENVQMNQFLMAQYYKFIIDNLYILDTAKILESDKPLGGEDSKDGSDIDYEVEKDKEHANKKHKQEYIEDSTFNASNLLSFFKSEKVKETEIKEDISKKVKTKNND